MRAVYIVFLLLVFSMSAGASIFEGPISSGGGQGVVCYDAEEKNVVSVELLDLWEARTLYERDIRTSEVSVRELVMHALQNLKNSIDSEGYKVGNNQSEVVGKEALFAMLSWDVERFLSEQSDRRTRRLRGVELTLTDDAYEIIKPVKCKIKQLVRYNDTVSGGEVIINQDLVDKMDNVNLAALYVHEVYYAWLRGYKERSSIRVRRAVGLIFSGYVFSEWNKFLSRSYYKCEDNLNNVFVYVDKRFNEVTYKVSMVDGRKHIAHDPPVKTWPEESLLSVFRPNGNISIDHLGFLVGSDFSYKLNLFRDGLEPVAKLTFLSSPDQSNSSEEATLKCEYFVD